MFYGNGVGEFGKLELLFMTFGDVLEKTHLLGHSNVMGDRYDLTWLTYFDSTWSAS